MTAHELFLQAGESRPTRVPLPNMTFKALGSDTGGAYSLSEFEATYDIPPHVHLGDDEGIYMLEGEADVRIGDTEQRVGPGGFVFMPRGIAHSITCASPPPIRALCISSPPGLQHFMEDLTEALVAGHDRSSPVVAEIRQRHGWVPKEP
ncbi:MAG: hypothetical protein NVS3B21_28790 [Acidimicrobiales bacterium]